MSPPERTFGPIGWKGLFGDDEESDDEAPDEETGTAGGGRDVPDEDPDGIGPPGTGAADAGAADAGAADAEAAGPSDEPEDATVTEREAEPSSVEDRVREERANRAADLADDEEHVPEDEWVWGGDRGADHREDADADRQGSSASPRRDADEAGTEDRETETIRETSGTEAARETEATETVSPEWAGEASERTDADPGAESTGVRDRIDAFYARYFLPPSVTDDEFDADESEASDAASSTSSSGAVGSTGSPDASEDHAATSSRDESEGAESTSSAGTGGGAGVVSGTSAGREREADAGTSSSPPTGTAEPPSEEPRVRTGTGDATSEGDAAPAREPAEESGSERTFGPIGLKWLSDEGEEEDAAPVADDVVRTDQPATVESRTEARPARVRAPAAEESTTEEEGLTGRVPLSISFTAIAVGVGLLIFLDIVSMMVPVIAALGAGIVGGFVAGYIAGGTVRGAMHALAVGIIGGIAVGYLTALIGALIGLFLEPATLLGNLVGPLAPDVGAFGAWGPLLVMVLVTAMVAIDATIAGVVGGTLRSMVDEVR